MRHGLLALCILGVLVPSSIQAHEINPRVIEQLTGETITYDHHEAGEADPDPRVASRRFYTIPEWLIVYTALEYGEFVTAGGEPSQFPYFASTKQLWTAWDEGSTRAGEAPDPTTNTVLYTIAISTTIEQGILGIYEGTVGRVFEWLDGGWVTVEDQYTNAVASEYGAFLLHTPWYEFPYGEKLRGLWSTWGLTSLTPRGIERRVAFTIGYGVKALYAGAIGYVSAREFSGGASLTTAVEVLGSHEVMHELATRYELASTTDTSAVVVLPRYRAFTSALLELVATEVTLESIMEHEQITFSVIESREQPCTELASYTAFSLPLLTDESRVRVIYDVPVRELADQMTATALCGYTIEHIYDF